MKQSIAPVALVVKDYDEAIEFYKEKLGFHLIEDTKLSKATRWKRMLPFTCQSC